MAINSILTTATSGLRASALRANSAANNIANVNTPGYTATHVAQSTVVSGVRGNLEGGTGVSAQLLGGELPVDLTNEIVALVEAEATYKANAEVIRTAGKLTKAALDIVG